MLLLGGVEAFAEDRKKWRLNEVVKHPREGWSIGCTVKRLVQVLPRYTGG